MDQKISLYEARQNDLRHYFTGKPCNRGHISKRYTSTRQCAMCQQYLADTNPNTKQVKQAYLDRNYALQLERNKRWRDSAPSHMNRLRQEWLDAHPGYMAVASNRNNSYRNQATPLWVDNDVIMSIYANCPSGYQVDHIVPIKGRTPQGYRVSGLHVPWNLQYLPKLENLAKKNRMRQEEYERVCQTPN